MNIRMCRMMCTDDMRIADVLWNMIRETAAGKMSTQRSGHSPGNVI